MSLHLLVSLLVFVSRCLNFSALAKHDEKKREREHNLKLEAMDILEEESKAVPVSEFIDLGMRAE